MSILRTLPVLAITTLLAACGQDSAPSPDAPAEAASNALAATDTVHEFAIGELRAFALKDGGFVLPNDNKTIAVGRSPEDVATLLSAAGASATELSLSIQPLLVQAGDKVLLFDTGAGSGAGENAGRLVASMKEVGIEPGSVTDIFISHGHGDHVGGLVDANGALVFANATVHLSAPEWDAMSSTTANDSNRAALVRAIEPKVETFAPAAQIVPDLVKAVEIKGHTPGHSGYLITSGEASLLYIGDTAHHYIVSVQEPEWTIQFDLDAPTAQASRKELIAESADSEQRIYAVHFPCPGLGRFSRRDDRFFWRPEE